MADEDDGNPKYVFITENGEKKNTSRGQTGKGHATYATGDIYEGDFLDGTREGRGKYMYLSNGDKYEGDWKANSKHGLGRIVYTGKGEYYGYWENGRRHGEGVFTYPNGDTYSGWFKFGEKEGTGTYTFKKSQMKLFGEWKMG
jgi:radial spoke head protein 1